MTPSQHTQIITRHNSCSTHFSPPFRIKCPGIYVETDEVPNKGVLDIDSGTSKDGLTKISKLILELASSVNEKVADSLMNLLTEHHCSLPNVLTVLES